MTDLYEHLLPAYREQAEKSDAVRIDWLRRDRWVALPQAEMALARLEDLVTYPPRGRMPCLLLFGSTGMGKSEILRRFAELHASTYDTRAGLTTMPVVVFSKRPDCGMARFGRSYVNIPLDCRIWKAALIEYPRTRQHAAWPTRG